MGVQVLPVAVGEVAEGQVEGALQELLGPPKEVVGLGIEGLQELGEEGIVVGVAALLIEWQC